MSRGTLSLLPQRVSIGVLQADGSVLASPELMRLFFSLFERAGGATGMGSADLAVLAAGVAQPDLQARRAAADAILAPALDQGAMIAALLGKMAALQAQVAQIESVHAEVAKLRKQVAGTEVLAGHRDPFRVNWERPGRIGSLKANTGAFTTMTAQTFNKLTLTTPASGATLALADGATLAVPAPGGTLGSAAYASASDFAARTGTSLGPAATDQASTQALTNTIRLVLLSAGVGT